MVFPLFHRFFSPKKRREPLHRKRQVEDFRCGELATVAASLARCGLRPRVLVWWSELGFGLVHVFFFLGFYWLLLIVIVYCFFVFCFLDFDGSELLNDLCF